MIIIKRLLISENHIMHLILKELNNNSLGVNFMMSNWLVSDRNDGSILIQRFKYGEGRFDVVNTFDETTYAENEITITPVAIPTLNGEFLTHPVITEVNYSPEVDFLINADDEAVVSANITALEEVRARLMQYQTNIEIEQYDLNDKDNKKEEVYKAVITSGDITYGSSQNFNGRKYLRISMPLNIYVSNMGEFANQMKFRFGTTNILEYGKPKMFDIPLITWAYGTGLETDSTQLLNNKFHTNDVASREVVSYKKSKAFALSFEVQIDFDNEFLLDVFRQSIIPSNLIPYYYIELVVNKYNKETKQYEEILSNTRVYNLEDNAPVEELSLGDKIYHNLTFSPSEKGID